MPSTLGTKHVERAKKAFGAFLLSSMPDDDRRVYV